MDPYIKQLNELVHRIEVLSEELDIANDLIESLLDAEISDLNEETLVEAKKWIQKAIKKEGALRKTMKTKEGKTIPVSKLKKAAEKGGKTGKRARLALTLRKLNEGGVVGQFNDADDNSGDEKIATQPDGLAAMEAQLEKMRDEFETAEHELSDPESRWSGTRMGREMKSKMLDMEDKIRAHPEFKARIAANMAKRAAEPGAGFFSQRGMGQDQFNRIDTAAERGLNMGAKRLPPTDYDLGRSSRKDK